MKSLSEQVMDDQEKWLRGRGDRILRAGEYLRDRIKDALGPSSKSGKLLASIQVRLDGDDIVVVYSDVEYASFVDKSKGFFTKTIEENEPEVRRIIMGEK